MKTTTPRGLKAEHVVKLRDILARLDAAGCTEDMNLPGLNPHPLKGDLKGFWAVILTTIEGGTSYADEEPPASRRFCAAPMY